MFIMSIETIGLIKSPSIPEVDKVQSVERLNPEPSQMEDGKIVIREMKINGELNPDIALIEASTNTPVQVYQGEGEVTEIFYSTTEDKPVGVILMTPEGEIKLHVYNPKTDGGQRGYSIKKGWKMQTVIPEGTSLTFFEYWSPRGFASQEGNKMYGEVALTSVTDTVVLGKFKKAEKALLEHIKKLL